MSFYISERILCKNIDCDNYFTAQVHINNSSSVKLYCCNSCYLHFPTTMVTANVHLKRETKEEFLGAVDMMFRTKKADLTSKLLGVSARQIRRWRKQLKDKREKERLDEQIFSGQV